LKKEVHGRNEDGNSLDISIVGLNKSQEITRLELDKYGVEIRFDKNGCREYIDAEFWKMISIREWEALNQLGEIKNAKWKNDDLSYDKKWLD
jgi:hypothetical protein